MNKFLFTEKIGKDIAIIIALSLLFSGILNFFFAINLRQGQIIVKHSRLEPLKYYAVKASDNRKVAGLLLAAMPGDTIYIYQTIPYRNSSNISSHFSNLFMIELIKNVTSSVDNLPVSFTFMSYKQYYQLKNTILIKPVALPPYFADSTIYPYNKNIPWNKDNFGKLIIPHKGMHLKLNKYTYELYAPMIEKYEGKKIISRDNKFFIKNKQVKYYTFQHDYYFFLNQNLNIPYDSRSWGPLPRKRIIGKIITPTPTQTATIMYKSFVP